ncbi:MAG: DUF4097 family beta strand repeat-containing protein [Candidatus Eisenbacteria bacterium]
MDRGSLSIGDVAGDADLHTARGEIEARRIGGSLRARGSRSPIYVYDIGGRGELSTVSGDVLVEECAGNLQVKVVGGNVDVIRAGADLFVSARRGNIMVRVGESPPGIRYELVSDRGDIDLALPGDWGVRIDGFTGSGTIQCFLPIVIEEIARNRLAGIAGEGGSEVRLDSRTGDIRVSRTD